MQSHYAICMHGTGDSTEFFLLRPLQNPRYTPFLQERDYILCKGNKANIETALRSAVSDIELSETSPNNRLLLLYEKMHEQNIVPSSYFLGMSRDSRKHLSHNPSRIRDKAISLREGGNQRNHSYKYHKSRRKNSTLRSRFL